MSGVIPCHSIIASMEVLTVFLSGLYLYSITFAFQNLVGPLVADSTNKMQRYKQQSMKRLKRIICSLLSMNGFSL